MSSARAASSLPASDSPHLALLHPTPEERFETWKLNGSSWRGRLSLEGYYRREEYLSNQPFTRDGGVTWWILVDTTATASPRTILASCETYRKRALVRRQTGLVEEVVSHGIGSVFCNPDFRGKGYARRMMDELGRSLDQWQQEDGKRADFTVLYSDIGKEFYSRSGWKPFPSSHIALRPIANDQRSSSSHGELPTASPLFSKDLADLCRADEVALKNGLATSHADSLGISLALVPDVETLQWHHAREEFVANELLGKRPEVKGAMISLMEGQRVWCIWTRTFGSEQDGNTLNILRLVIEGEVEEREQSSNAASKTRIEESNRHQILAAASVIRSACLEAAEWTMDNVHIWNPSALTALAARHVEPAVEIIEREDESIASLRWHGPVEAQLKWIGNEKYGWC